MKRYNLEERTKMWSRIFAYDKVVRPDDSRVAVSPYSFQQQEGGQDILALQHEIPVCELCQCPDENIVENTSFSYYILAPDQSQPYKWDKAILLLHGLNERSWDKYLPWAEYLAETCGVPIILFPIAFHINRTPKQWIQPRWLMPWLNRRKEQNQDLCNASFFNVALSSRLSNSPLRFYISGRESALNLCQLLTQIQQGKHPLFKEDARVNLFAYSIGALLSQVMLMANPNKLLSQSRFFAFCGGSIFEKMNGNAKDIIDQNANDSIKKYYLNDFLYHGTSKKDSLEKAFQWMISPFAYAAQRESFFEEASQRCRMITLKKDTVIPTLGVCEAVGKKLSPALVQEMDFPFEYTHQMPFPCNKKIPALQMDDCFESVFSKVAAFIG